jgi:putative two-component system response regulator
MRAIEAVQMQVPDPEPPLARILVVEDDDQMRRLIARSVSSIGHPCTLAGDAAEARAKIAAEDIALMICDVGLPGQSGLDLVRHVLTEHPTIAALMVSGSDRPDLAEAALEYGAYGYLVKPFTITSLHISVMNAMRRRDLEQRHRAQTERLEQEVFDRTASLRAALSRLEESAKQLEASREETIRRLSRAMEYRDPETACHLDRMSHYCALISARLGIDARTLEIASPMHDIGKIGVPDEILLKPGGLTPEERKAMQSHAQIGYDMLRDSDSDLLRLAAVIAWTHHERYDGGGYPRGLRGEEIPLEGRIAAVADVFDALTSDRPYRAAMPVEQALGIMRAERGRHFDPRVLDAFLESLDKTRAAEGAAPSAA